MTSGGSPSGSERFPVGRTFLHPVLDYLLIGGGLSLLLVPLLPASGNLYAGSAAATSIPVIVLMCNSAHFAASTVRLYSKPGAMADWPFLSLGFPLLTLVVLTAAIGFSALVGQNLNALYLTWSPFHYAAQTFGLSVMYCYRSGRQLSVADKRLLRAVCMLPFLYAFTVSDRSGLRWFVEPSTFAELPWLGEATQAVAQVLRVLAIAAPIALVAWRSLRGRPALPLIVPLLCVTNGIWWVVFPYLDAFIWATVFHSVQYLVIVCIFHVRDHPTRPDSQRGKLFEAARFYAMCLGLGYGLFHLLPYAYVLAGFRLSESMFMVLVAINLHHFIVDAFIWKVSKGGNYRIAVGSG